MLLPPHRSRDRQRPADVEAGTLIKLVLDPVIASRLIPRLRPEIQRRRRVTADAERDKMVFLVVARVLIRLAEVTQLANLQRVRVRGGRTLRMTRAARPLVHAGNGREH